MSVVIAEHKIKKLSIHPLYLNTNIDESYAGA